ncbi:MAG: RluA family pseudouridine synthase [Verrucomicrobia bacterium]|nr:RluA family pseudouridine synthase [Verrucomicrobiota bacterium]
MRYVVSSQEHGLSLLAFLKSKGAYSVKDLKKAIASKACKVGGSVEFFSSRKLAQGEEVEFDSSFLTKEDLSIAILFEDSDFVIVNKSAGIVSLPEEFKKFLGPKSTNWSLVHRLDKDTSGIVLLAKNPKAEEAAKKLFSARSIEKLYLAIVDGRLFSKQGIIDSYLGKKGGYQGQTLYGSVSEKEGQRAITHYRLLALGKESSLVLCDLKTGRTHQIRVHLSELHHPILGDDQYRKKTFSCSYQPKRHLLHAWKLIFVHPFTLKNIKITAPIPADFDEALKNFGIKWEE